MAQSISLMSYNFSHETKMWRFPNLGDAIQTLALVNLLKDKDVRYVDRHEISGYDSDDPLIINGWHCFDNQIPNKLPDSARFIGFHTTNIAWIPLLINSKHTIGCRDTSTVEFLKSNGVDAYLSGCSTLTFNKFNSDRYGKYIVVDMCDMDPPPNYEKVTHTFNRHISWQEQMELAEVVLMKYMRAEHVITDRLHVYIPCLSFGTPVEFCMPKINNHPLRLQLIKDVEIFGADKLKEGFIKNFNMIIK